MSTLIAARGLYEHVAAVAAGLEQGLEEGRHAVAHIVGRDPASLDAHGVARAAIEIDRGELRRRRRGALVLGRRSSGCPGMAAYKAINTLDSMIGHRSPRYLHFGRFAARLDDLANWLPARLAAFLILAASLCLPGASPADGWRALWRDAPRHRSPNAGWPEAAIAGALGLRLAGPRRYAGETVDDAWMGAGRAAATPPDIRRALRLLVLACGLAAALLALPALVGGLTISRVSSRQARAGRRGRRGPRDGRRAHRGWRRSAARRRGRTARAPCRRARKAWRKPSAANRPWT